jgi:bifunctional enzyme CysN/CysC
MAGEVDHGKSSVVGRLLAEAGAIPASAMEKTRQICRAQNKEFEYAFLLDAFEEEQRQGVTIDVSYIQFATAKRAYQLIDAPGHREFLKNMVSGAGAADAAVLLLDARDGATEQSRRHCYLLKLLGIESVVVAVNKMDLKAYSAEAFAAICAGHAPYLAKLGLAAIAYVPVSAKFGANIAARALETHWYSGPTLLEALDLFQPRAKGGNRQAPLRLPVQDVYKFDRRRIIAGRIESGSLRPGTKLRIWPSGKDAEVATIERWPAPVATGAAGPASESEQVGCASPGASARAGESIGITLTEQVFIERGDALANRDAPMTVSSAFDASVFWMGRRPLRTGDAIRVKLATQDVLARVARIYRVIDTTTLAARDLGPAAGSAPTAASDSPARADSPAARADPQINAHEAAEIALQAARPLALDEFALSPATGRFVLVDNNEVAGGGIITASSAVPGNARPAVGALWLTGLSGAGKTTLAEMLARELAGFGAQAFVLDGDAIRRGLNSDLGFSAAGRNENVRRVAEVAKLFAASGQIAIVALISPFAADRELARAILRPYPCLEIYLRCPLEICEERDIKGLYRRARNGELREFTGVSAPYEEPLRPDLALDTGSAPAEQCVAGLIALLKQNKWIF